jgi:hypothetical protein
MDAVGDDLWLPKGLRQITCALMDEEAAKRPTPTRVIEVLEQNEDIRGPEPAADRGAQVDYEEVVEGVCDYLLGALSRAERTDSSRPTRRSSPPTRSASRTAPAAWRTRCTG